VKSRKGKIMFQKSHYCIILLLLMIFLTACSPTKDISIGVLVPAYVNIPGRVKSLSLVSRVYPENIKGSLDSLNDVILDSTKNYYPLSAEGLFAVSDVLEKSPRYQQVKISGNYEGIKDVHHPDASIPWEEVKEKCDSDSTDELLSLEYFNLSDSLFINTDFFGYYVIEYLIFIKTFWKLYDPFNFQIDDYYSQSDTLKWNRIELTFTDAATNFPTVENMIIKVFNKAGTEYGRRIAPYWVDGINRMYFIAGNKEFRLAKKYIRKNEWKKAAELWNPQTLNPDKKIAARAAFNMALACEMQNRIDLAIPWIEKSDTLIDNPITKKYWKILETRLRVNKIIDSQLNQ
jgi:hypothetical protein